MSLAGELIDWVGKRTVTQGRYVGKPFTLLRWEKEFLECAFAPGIKTAALSVGRGNGKSTLLGAVAAACVAGPLALPRAECIGVAAAFQQVRILFEHARDMIPSMEKSSVRVLDSTAWAQLEQKYTKARFRAIASDPQKAHGLAPFLVIADEAAQWQRTQREAMYSALVTSLGKIPESRFITIGTQPDDGTHFFARLLEEESSATHYSMSYACEKDCDILDPAEWYKANPSLEHMPDLYDTIKTEAEKAAADPGLEFQFRALRLNSGTPDNDMRDVLISAQTWRECLAPDVQPEGEYVLGLDLGGAAAFSAASAYWLSLIHI